MPKAVRNPATPTNTLSARASSDNSRDDDDDDGSCRLLLVQLSKRSADDARGSRYVRGLHVHAYKMVPNFLRPVACGGRDSAHHRVAVGLKIRRRGHGDDQ